MHKFIFILFCLGFFGSFSQTTNQNKPGFGFGVSYSNQFVAGGFVQVREWELTGDKMRFKDLEINNIPTLLIFVKKDFNSGSAIRVDYERYFIHGKSIFNRNIAYNGTLIDGTKGIDVSPTIFYYLRLDYKGRLKNNEKNKLSYHTGLIYDYINFFLDGVVSRESRRDEVYEGFYKQAFPYPYLGVSGEKYFNEFHKLTISLSGTYIPEFKSFFKEGGNIYLHYKNLESDIIYTHMLSKFEFSAGGKLRYMYLSQDSFEDTNVISSCTAGPFIELKFNF